MEYKIDEIVTLPPYDIKARVVAVKKRGLQRMPLSLQGICLY